MTSLTAKETELDVALTLMRMWEEIDSDTNIAGSSLWYRAAAKVRGPETLTAVVFEDSEGQPVGTAVFCRDRAGWRSGSPRHKCLRWPFQELGYHFSPAWHSEQDPRRSGWIEALTEAFPTDHLELARCSPLSNVAPIHSTMRVQDGSATWTQSVDDIDSWRETLKGSHRRDLDYYKRRIEKAKGDWLDLTSTDNLQPALAECFEMHSRRVANKGQVSAYLTDDGRAFLTALAELDRSAVRITRLKINYTLAATCLSFVRARHYHCFMPGWDPARRGLDLGRQVIYHQIVEEFTKGLNTIDLLGGDLDYKKEFGLSPLATSDIVSRPTKTAAKREELVNGALRIYRKFVRS